jgi:dUTP pyrophosphatase
MSRTKAVVEVVNIPMGGSYGDLIPTIKVQRLTPTAKLPTKTHASDIGYDLYCDMINIPNGSETFIETPACVLQAKDIFLVRTGIKATIGDGWELQIRPRSGLALKGITVSNAPGTIDPSYRGEIQIILINNGKNGVQIKQGDRVAQMVPALVPSLEIVEVDSLDDTVRGASGFGSTGR